MEGRGGEGWSIAHVARMSGVSSRTLRHYDAIGLLSPAWTGTGGRRYYGQEELLRLQQVLLLRQLGLGLDAVADVLARTGIAATAQVLRHHHERLLAERDRLDRLATTVAATITSLEEGTAMAAEQLFQGFSHNPYDAEARERWGDAAVDASNEKAAALTPEQATRIRGTYQRVHDGLAEVRAAGVPVSDERVQALVAEHYGVVSVFWTPDAASYTGLGQLYVDDDRFRATIGQGDDALVEYLRDAMAVYAARSLA